jgi:hypothetical protein
VEVDRARSRAWYRGRSIRFLDQSLFISETVSFSCMLSDLTVLDSFGWEAIKKALNQRVVLGAVRLVPSRRNRVWVVETDVRPVVVKRSLSGKCGNEFEVVIQAKSAGLNVPYPLFMEGDYLVFEYLQGETCDMLINHMFSSQAAEGMGEWLASFHGILGNGSTCKVMNDAVLTNFILSDQKIFGVDLEDAGPGNPLDDVGQLSAAILGSEPFFTPVKFDLCLRMLQSYERTACVDVVDIVRPYVSKHLLLDSKNKPLFRRTMVSAARSIEKGWPALA